MDIETFEGMKQNLAVAMLMFALGSVVCSGPLAIVMFMSIEAGVANPSIWDWKAPVASGALMAGATTLIVIMVEGGMHASQ